MICSKKECTGCYACYNICPKKAIEMLKDEYGNVYPVIDKNKCVNCDLCKKICPQLKKKLEFKKPLGAYAMYIKDEYKRKESTSGGAATAFYEYVLNNGGIIYGAANLFGKNQFEFIRINNKNDLYKVKGSKYVHCYINETFSEVKKDLINNKMVLFIGTPCQVSGLKSYLLKEYENLITIDIICHGVPSQKLLFDEIKMMNIDYKEVAYIYFRDDKGYNLRIMDFQKKVLVEKNSDLSDYYKNFLEGNIYRENCYNCRYAQINRISDITIGDFWGLSMDSKIYDDEKKGISVIIPCTKRGRSLIQSIFEQHAFDERTIEEACKINGQLNKPMSKTRKFKIYYDNYPKIGYKNTMKKMRTFKDKIIIFIKKRPLLLNIIRKVKKL